ncbi:RNA-binding domain-containing protein [Amycolatopsis umgeniensis]|uniref:Putative HTH transcriptional regulator n=1 Tax=Amycolatopsis umgeniensis TaxID=336628 RepID=A0A841BC40_9PSEU|nr:putative HTH transcriptional regulator [Amycolatopsis umgeniensis]
MSDEPRPGDDARLIALVHRLIALPRETEWVEFKENFFKAEDIGQYISALANSAALGSQDKGYMVWGVSDTDHTIVGTTMDQHGKVGNEDFLNWLTRLLAPQIHFEFLEFEVEGKRVVLLEVAPATASPVRFQSDEWIRVGSYKKKLRDHPDHARRLWQSFDSRPFETLSAASGLDTTEVLRRLDYPGYFDLMGMPLPDNRKGILDALEMEELVRRNQHGDWDITNLGAVLFAKNINDFTSLKRKAVRVIRYRGDSRVSTIREQSGVHGYAPAFAGLVNFVNNMLPSVEVISEAIRGDERAYPELAVRELIANAIIHQDFAQTGNGPMIEIFDTRLEITSPGRPLVDPLRFVDAPPKSRNEAIGALMRRAGMCEERGSGWDKVVSETELHQLPAPLVELPEDNTRVVLFAPKPLNSMSREEKVRAVYLHACLRRVNHETLTNSSLRERFGISQQNAATASRLISDAVAANLIVPFDTAAGRRFMQYLPYWAADTEQPF